MVCVYCGGETEVLNSRPQQRVNKIWRRRSCRTCLGVFTTIENIETGYTHLVKKTSGHLEPFLRDKIFISIYDSCKHRKSAVEDSTALTDTVISSILQQSQNGIISTSLLRQTVLSVLQKFDSAASVFYQSYFHDN